jgi:Fe2+ or Zn2+ uptake regulation protein
VRTPQGIAPGRMTWQRGAVLQAMEAAHCHLTAEEIHRCVRRSPHPIGLATVYRALETFVREGRVEPVHVGDGSVRYGLSMKHHDHLVCLGCGQWKPLRHCVLSRAPERVAREFRVTGHQVEIYGYCARCQASAQ